MWVLWVVQGISTAGYQQGMRDCRSRLVFNQAPAGLRERQGIAVLQA